MAQTGYTPISLYYSTTASQAPTAGNLANGELAINITDGKLYYKDNTGTVKVIAGTGGTGVVAGSNTQIQFNNNGVFGASANLTWDGSFLTVASIKNSALTSGRVTYAGASGLLTDSANLTFNGTTLTAGGLTTTGTTSTGVLSVTGNTTLGDASADTVTVNGTITSNLIFTDNTYDIGASGATRPRSIFLAGNATVGGLTSGRLTFAGTGGLLSDSANLAWNGTTLSVVGRLYNGDASTFGASTWGMSLGNGGVSANYFKASTTYWQTDAGTQIAQLNSSGLTLSTSLLFSADNTYDIGANGATRPRSIYTSGSIFVQKNADPLVFTTANGTTSAGNVSSVDNGSNNWFYGVRNEGTGGVSGTQRFNVLYGNNGLMNLNSAGNVGFGGAFPSSAWSSDRKAVEVGGTTTGYFVAQGQGTAALAVNLYNNGTNDLFYGNGYAPLHELSAGTGAHTFYTSNLNSSGAGATVSLTKAMTLTTAGKLILNSFTNPSAPADSIIYCEVPSSASLATAGQGIIVKNTGASTQIQMSRMGSSYSYLGATGPGGILYSYDKLSLVVDTSGPLTFNIAGSEAGRISPSNQALLLGTTSVSNNLRASQRLGVVQVGTNNAGASIVQYSAGSTAHPILDFNFSRGGSDGTYTKPNSGDRLGVIVFRGADGSGWIDSSLIAGEADGTTGGNDMPGRLVFYTTPDGGNAAIERMRIDNVGRTTTPYQPAFRAGRSGTQSVSVGSTYVWNSVTSNGKQNIQSAYNTGTGVFTAPVAGSYYFHAQVIIESATNNANYADMIIFRINGSLAAYSEKRCNYVANTTGNDGYFVDNISAILYLSAGDTVYCTNQSPNAVTMHSNDNYAIFEGYLLG